MSNTPNDLNTWTRRQLLALPLRAWDETSVYHSVMLFKAVGRHDSGWARIAIVGIGPDGPVELATTCSDDITWDVAPDVAGLRMDCAWKSGGMHAWCNRAIFEVSAALSSVTIRVQSRAAEGQR